MGSNMNENIPIIKDWELVFAKKDGKENAALIASRFAEFMQNLDEGTFEVPGDCVLSGKVYGRINFRDGDRIFTSNLRTISRFERGDMNGTPHDLMCALTKSGSNYFFYSDDHSGYMALLLGSFIHA